MKSTDLRETADACFTASHHVATVERCATFSARVFRMEVRLHTVFGIPYGGKKAACVDPLAG